MSLVDLELPDVAGELPAAARTFLREARRRIEQFQKESRLPAFVPSDFERAYGVLQGLADAALTPGRLFCEWGSGFGVVTCLAAMLDFDACGIEIEPELVDAAQRLAGDFDLPVEMICGSFIPAKSAARVAGANDFAWLSTECAAGAAALDLAPADFHIIFAYPWPDEERLVETLFEEHAAPGALLMTHHDGESFRLRRKRLAKRSRGAH